MEKEYYDEMEQMDVSLGKPFQDISVTNAKPTVYVPNSTTSIARITKLIDGHVVGYMK